jgi:hypothetical protein
MYHILFVTGRGRMCCSAAVKYSWRNAYCFCCTHFVLIWFQREDATSQASFGGASQEIRASVDTGSSSNPQSTSVLHQNGTSGSGGEPQMHERMDHKYPDSGQANGAFRRSSGEPAAVDNGGRSHSQFSTPSSRSLSPTR